MAMKRAVQILMMMTLLLVVYYSTASTIYASSFPEREQGIFVLDPEQVIDAPDKKNLQDYLAPLAHDYVVLYLKEPTENGFDLARTAFDHYQLGANSFLFIVSTTDPWQLTYAYGSALAEQGITDDMIEDKKEAVFTPLAREGNFTAALSSLVTSIELELEELALSREQAAALTVRDSTPAQEEAKTAKKGKPWWIIGLTFLFIAIISFLIFSFVYRRQITKQIDQLEVWKIDLENRPFTSQLARIKGLTLAGETETRFELWRTEWDTILTNTLPDIEETLIDIEEDADGYRFLRSRQRIAETKERLERIEQDLENIISEIDELTSSEKQNREKAVYLHEQYQEIRSSLQKHALTLGISYPVWQEKFKQSTKWFEQYTEAQAGGDYLLAKDLLQKIETLFAQITEAIHLTPGLLRQVEEEIPRQLQDLETALKEMQDKGYHLTHTGAEERFAQLLKKKHEIILDMEKGHISKLQEWIAEVEQEIEQLYVILEEEVEAKAYVLSMLKQIPEQYMHYQQQHEQIIYESSITKQSYAWEEEWEEELNRIKQFFKELGITYRSFDLSPEEVEETYPQLKAKVIRYEEQASTFIQAVQAFKEEIKQLRIEEIEAKRTAEELRQTLIQLHVQLRKSNLPGIPEHLRTGLILAEETVGELQDKLGEIPLNMHQVNHILQEAKAEVDSVTQVTLAVVEQADRAEQLIQFANRYRRSHQEIRYLLEEAEEAFRQLQYREAVELAEEALDLGDKYWRERWEDAKIS